jgi:SAM-dependent methyltransferase
MPAPARLPTTRWSRSVRDVALVATNVKPPPAPALRALLALGRWLRQAREGLLPPQAVVVERTLALLEIRALGVAAELDVARLVGERPRTTADLAAATATDPDALDRVLALLAATGCFRRGRDGRWHNTRLSAALCDDHEYAMRGWARFFAGGRVLRIIAEADSAVATGGSATSAATGMGFFEWAHEGDPEFGRSFDAAMRDASASVARSLSAVVDLDGVRTVCDVGGGTGMLLATLLAEHPALHGILFDLPAVVERAAPLLSGAAEPGVADRVRIVGGSFFDRLPAADRLVLVSVVHDWDDDRAVDILRSCRAALPDGGRVLLVETVRDPDRPGFIDRHTDLLMLLLTGAGRERTAAELERLWQAAGLRSIRTWRLVTMQTVFELAAA